MTLRFRSPSAALTEEQRLCRKRVLHQVTCEPQTFNMDTWDTRLETAQGLANIGITMFELAACGTVRCLAGWALHFAGIDIIAIVTAENDALLLRGLQAEPELQAEAESDGIEQAAITALGLTRAEYGSKPLQLFYVSAGEAVARLRALCEA